MIYPANFEQKVGFDRLREQVAALCTIRGGRERLCAEQFSTSQADVERRLALADEMRRLLEMERDFPDDEFVDVDYILSKLKIEGSFLEVEEVVLLRRALASAGAIAGFILGRGEELYPELRLRSRGIEAFPEIVRAIDGIVDQYGKIRDDASPELQQIRRMIREREGQAAKRLQQVLSNAKKAGIVEADAMLSIRDGRAVIPVAAANKRKLQGFIHDESATGKTFYVEPVEVVEINNELKELEYAERREIVRILSAFTDSIRPEADRIALIGDYLSDLDMIRAKARWAVANGAVKPIVSTDDRLVLRNARHPLLQQTLRAQGKQVVPLDLQLDKRRHILVISGPNAGGKSVCLKTTGIIQYMFQCGFLVPASENSELPLFRNLMIDIGDEQSIDDDLSTYSSHLLNMKNMLAGASNRTLVLIDEFGSGTEPIIGGAIAESILERLRSKGCYGVITTHYANIKYYASNTEGIANGAMMFDVQNIRPLFRLEIGKPGSSFAVEIARKIGLPEDIIRDAGEKAGSDHINLEKQLREIARDKHYWEQKRDRIRIADRKVEELEQTYADQLSRIRQERSEILKKAKEEAQRMIALVSDILQLSELDSNQASRTHEAAAEAVPVDLAALVKETAQNMTVNARRAYVTLQYDARPATVQGSRDQLSELTQNLCDNAIRYNRPGGHVELRCGVGSDGCPYFEVEDNGIGIPQDSQTRVFERFYRVDKSRSKATGGTGLGLAIVKHIALLHDARIDLQSQVGTGTTIRVTFPKNS